MKIKKRHIIILALLCIICLMTGCSKKSSQVENSTQINGTGQKVETSGNSISTGDGSSSTSNGTSSQVSQSTSEGSQTSQGTQASENTQAAQSPKTSQQTSTNTSGTNQNNEAAKPTPQGDTTTTGKGDKKEQGILSIEGSGVKSQVSYTLNDLKNMNSGIVEEDYFALNNYGTKKYYHFKGISTWYLLSQRVGLMDGAKKVIFIADDGYSVEYTIGDVKRDDYISEDNLEKKYRMIIAWEEEGKEYDKTEGTPLKLVVGQKEPGDVNKPNWVQTLKTIKVE